jgi:hypothetical protein
MTKTMLDLEQIQAEADAHEARMKSPLWADDNEEQDENWMAPVVEDARREVATAPDQAPDPEILLRLDGLRRELAELTEAVARIRIGQPLPPTEIPAWLQAAAGNPLTYDAPDSTRESVCVRVLPTTHARLRQVHAHLGLRTMAGTWECLLRLGIAAAERLPLGSTAF